MPERKTIEQHMKSIAARFSAADPPATILSGLLVTCESKATLFRYLTPAQHSVGLLPDAVAGLCAAATLAHALFNDNPSLLPDPPLNVK